MKKVLSLILLGFTIISCGTLPQPQSLMNVIDYSPLIKEGIYVTESNSVNFDYIAIGSVVATEKGGWNLEKKINPSTESIFKGIVKELKKMGANGIINVNVTYSSEIASFVTSPIYVPTITVKGMAIKTASNKLADIPLETPPNVVEKSPILGEIDNIKCWIIKKYSNGIRIGTSQELSVDQIRKAKSLFSLKGKIMFDLQGYEDKNQSYAGIEDNHIILYNTNEFIKL